MSIITPSDFKGELNLPNTDGKYADQGLQIFIDKYEPKFIRALFGKTLGNLLIAGLAEDPVDARWTALMTADFKYALTCYVYWWYLRDNTSYTGGSGVVKSNSENASNVSPVHKLCKAWNDMVTINREIATDIDLTVYPEFTKPYWYGCGWYGHGCNEVFTRVNALGI